MRATVRQASLGNILKRALGIVLMPGSLINLRWLAAVGTVTLVALRVFNAVGWPWVWVVAPLWIGVALHVVGRAAQRLLEPALGTQKFYRWRGNLSFYGKGLLFFAVLPALKAAGLIHWSWWWVLSPVWFGVGFEVAATAVFFAARSVLGSERTLNLSERVGFALFHAGIGGIATVVLGVLKLTGTVNLSWPMVLVPLGANLATWLAIYAIAFAWMVYFDRMWHR